MARKGFTLCAACSELTPAAGGYCRLCRTPLIQARPGPDEGHCPACGTLVGLHEPTCYGCGWRLHLAPSMVAMIAICMAALSALLSIALIGLYARIMWSG